MNLLSLDKPLLNKVKSCNDFFALIRFKAVKIECHMNVKIECHMNVKIECHMNVKIECHMNVWWFYFTALLFSTGGWLKKVEHFIDSFIYFPVGIYLFKFNNGDTRTMCLYLFKVINRYIGITLLFHTFFKCNHC